MRRIARASLLGKAITARAQAFSLALLRGIASLLLLILLLLSGCASLLNSPPVAQFSASANVGDAPLTVTFDGSATTDVDGDVEEYRWSFGDGSGGLGAIVSCTYSEPGLYIVALQVRDAHGETDSCSLAVAVRDPLLLYIDDFEVTDDGFWDFVFYCQDNWTYESDLPGEPSQDPRVSDLLKSGDCDDFAGMIAYYAEEHWPYESTTARLYMTTVDDYHRVAAVRAGMNTIDWYYAPCEPGRPFFRKDGATYLPISQARCVWWDADSIEVISFAEWDEIVGTVRSVTPCPLLEALELGTAHP